MLCSESCLDIPQGQVFPSENFEGFCELSQKTWILLALYLVLVLILSHHHLLKSGDSLS